MQHSTFLLVGYGGPPNKMLFQNFGNRHGADPSSERLALRQQGRLFEGAVPKLGDIVTVQTGTVTTISRVVGLPGDRIESPLTDLCHATPST